MEMPSTKTTTLTYIGSRRKRPILTLQKPHSTVETLRAELIVPERTQELADKNISLLGDVDESHVSEQQFDFRAPFSFSSAL